MWLSAQSKYKKFSITLKFLLPLSSHSSFSTSIDKFAFSRISRKYNQIVFFILSGLFTYHTIWRLIHGFVCIIIHFFLLLSSILSYGFTTISWPINLLMGIYIVSGLRLLIIKLPWTIAYKSLEGCMFSFLWVNI